jgi:hypothetical protein
MKENSLLVKKLTVIHRAGHAAKKYIHLQAHIHACIGTCCNSYAV